MTANTTGTSNVAVGKGSLEANTTADSNTAIGYLALLANTTGAYNVAIGALTLDAATTANSNTGVGYAVLSNATTGAENTAMGVNAAQATTTGANNVAIGTNALVANTTASNNVAVGSAALTANTTGADNTAVGKNAGSNITTGGEHVIIGTDAAPTLTTGGRCTVVGEDADVSGQAGYEQVFGWSVHSAGGDRTTIGAAGDDSALTNGATTWTAPSDRRLKEEIEDEKVGLDFIKELRPVTFRWKKEKDVPEELRVYKAGSEKRIMGGKYNHGFIAQEVKEVIDKHGLKEGFEMWSEDVLDGRQRVGEGALIPMLVKSIQELSAEVEELKQQLNNNNEE